ncbi:pilus assembly protein TadE [Paenarthrobacter ureafaciens]|jgi:Flp pilus assembly protein TadG|uniref:TadE/TadG family type IV pilus assembly protein n=1 Tax=Paenarthrobacter TaxID=1742992 RepID=UPI00074D45D5|nr:MULTISPECIES: TadE/TadG family type IV pilus assembly protein [Paenarthrobacter]AMB41237.1 pilus assembly protein TadE [Arthrobacter sp. ATCC 21022]KUR64313.1 pilus assembly protein TadE [Arthrobacter sp. ATCC 21022]MCW3765884.1 pilus assembly protein [Paenarthrobacter sp. PAE-2]NWL27853.1 pilus assembly protein TadE [Paenarthrobacter ureafaciens]QQQ61457.1 pilus assembly protein [Paenarthrobacter ureafaciens]
MERKERGAVAIEMAILLPLLLLILIGIIEFGRVLNVQVSLTQAAREGARYAAVHYQDGALDVSGTALAAAPSLNGLGVTVSDNAASCSPGSNVTVTTSVALPSMSGFLDAGFFGAPGIFPMNMSGVGVMRCGG